MTNPPACKGYAGSSPALGIANSALRSTNRRSNAFFRGKIQKKADACNEKSIRTKLTSTNFCDQPYFRLSCANIHLVFQCIRGAVRYLWPEDSIYATTNYLFRTGDAQRYEKTGQRTDRSQYPSLPPMQPRTLQKFAILSQMRVPLRRQ